ncbi:MAG: zinc metallopeptidase [Planctomycetales bacterium]|nr:zinc metallopeptidase [Planctomycetales bacterium]
MRWRGREQSQNVEDRRRMSPAMAAGGGIGVVVMALVAMFLGADPGTIARILGQGRQPQVVQQAGPAVDDDAKEFISVVLRDTENVWTQLFRAHVRGGEYQPPKLVMFSGQVRSGCGPANAAVGPFYCPADQQVYIDPQFFDQLAQRHDAPGDFAQAYVIAHEVAHHVQYLLGYSDKVNQIRQRGNELDSNRASVRLELQADYLAGVWAHHAQKDYSILEPGDIQEAINAANQIGDDTLQRQATGYVIPDRFTHGSSEQRMRWLSEGLRTGDINAMEELFTIDYDSL